MEVYVVVTYGGILGRLARWAGLKWNHAALRYVRAESEGARIIEAGPFGVQERSWRISWPGSRSIRPFRSRTACPR